MYANLRSEIAESLHEAASAYQWAVWLDEAARHFRRTDLHVSATRYRRLFDNKSAAGLSMIRRLHQSRPRWAVNCARINQSTLIESGGAGDKVMNCRDASQFNDAIALNAKDN